MRPLFGDRLGDRRITGKVMQRRVKRHIRVDEIADGRVDEVDPIDEAPFHGGGIVRRRCATPEPRRSQFSGQTIECRADLVKGTDAGAVDRGDGNATLSLLDEKSATLEHLQGVAHRLAGDAEHQREFFLGQPAAGFQRTVDDGGQQPVVHLIDQGRLRLELSERRCRHRLPRLAHGVIDVLLSIQNSEFQVESTGSLQFLIEYPSHKARCTVVPGAIAGFHCSHFGATYRRNIAESRLSMVLVLDATPERAAPVPPVQAKPTLAGRSREGMRAALAEIGVPEKQLRMRTEQLWSWVYVRGIPAFEQMSDVSKDLRHRLHTAYSLTRPDIVSEQVSVDGTRKWLLRLAKRGHDASAPEIETVYIPEADRGTLCISSQVGCTLTCSFCHTGTQRLVRNLEPDEIVGQILLARDRIGDWPGAEPQGDPSLLPQSERKITNIVLMGMGEPLYNFDNVRQAMEIAADGDGLSMSKRRITLSTSGVVPEIARWGAEAGTMLAISLHAVRDELRDQLLPINRRYPIASLLDACRTYPSLSNARRITFEYVMLKDVNDSLADARALVKLLAGIPAKINLIPFNPWPGSAYECSEWEQIERFADLVNKAGYASPVRTPRGRDILAACGQLRSESVKVRASARTKAEALERPSDGTHENGSA